MLYVANLGTNLISVHSAVQKGKTVVFDFNGCSMYGHDQVKVSGQPLCHGTFSEVNGLYKLDQVQTKAPAEQALLTTTGPDSELWHRRLGHLCRIGLDQLR